MLLVRNSGGCLLEMGSTGIFSVLRIFAVGYLQFRGGDLASPQLC